MPIEVARLEAELAKHTSPDSVEGGICRRGAVARALKAGDKTLGS